MVKQQETNLTTYALWKLVVLVFFILFCVNVSGNFYDKLPTLLIFFQLMAIESLLTARADGIIEYRTKG